MRYISLYKPAKFGIPDQQTQAALGKLVEEMTRSGTLLSTGGFAPSPKDVKVRVRNGDATVIDGPFTETKELIGGYALLELPSREAAIEAAKRFLGIVGGGECEIHELMDGAPHE